MSKFSDATFYLAPSGYKEGILFPQKPLSTNGEISFTRASSAWRTNIEGQVEETCYNLLQYSEDFNVTWSKSNATVTSNTTTAPDGNTTADTLTPDATNTTHRISYLGGNAGTLGYTLSVFAKSNGYNFLQIAGGVNVDHYGNFNLSTGVVTQTGLGTIASIANVGNGWYRCSITIPAISGANILIAVVNSGTSAWQEAFTANGTSGIFIWGAQLVQGSLPRPYLSTTTRQNFPRVDYSLGTGTFLLEPQRTNSIRNSTGVGAVVGSPGTIPTNWFSTNAGLTRTIVGTGVENGLSYIDLKFNGTATGTSLGVYIDNISLSGSQTWTLSAYVKLVSGVFNSSAIAWDEYNGGSYIGGKNQTISVTSTLDRYVLSATTAASCTNAYPTLYFYVTSGSSYDFTVRIAQPQMELGAYVTSPIFTTTSAVTRLADFFSRGNIFTNNLISSSGGTWFVELKNNLSVTNTTTDRGIFIGDTSAGIGNTLSIRRLNAGRLQVTKVVGGSTSLLYTTTTDAVKIAIKWNGTSVDVFENGVKVVSASAFTTTNMEFLATRSGEEPYQNISQMALWRTPLTDAQCIDLTL